MNLSLLRCGPLTREVDDAAAHTAKKEKGVVVVFNLSRRRFVHVNVRMGERERLRERKGEGEKVFKID